MNENRDDLLRELAAANPVKREDLTDWPKSEEGRRVFQKALARRQKSASGRPGRTVLGRYRLAWAGGVLVALAAVVVFVVLWTSPAPKPLVSTAATQTASTQAAPATTQATETPGGAVEGRPYLPGVVSEYDALAGVLSLAADLSAPTQTLRPSSPAPTSAQLVQEAEGLGVLRPSETSGGLEKPVLRKEFALWLWRAFGMKLASKMTTTFSDLGSLGQEERQAVAGLAQAGILEGYPGGAFQGNRELRRSEMQSVLARLGRAIETN